MTHKITLILLLLFGTLNAQHKYSSRTYDVTNFDVQINMFPQDSLAKAVVIYEEGESYVDDDSFKLITKIKRKIKVLDRLDSNAATVELYLYNNEGDKKRVTIKDISGTTYNLVNNQIRTTQLMKSDIFTEREDDNYRSVKFTLPNVQDGSVITYEYTLESPFFYKYHGWQFQEEIPKLYSEYRTSVPANYDYHIKLVGFKDLDIHESYIQPECLHAGLGATADCTNTKYVMTDIPSFIEEDYMTTKSNYLSRIEYELKTVQGFDGSRDKITKTWKDVDKELKTDPDIGRQLQKTSLTKNIEVDGINSTKNQLDKAKLIYHHVQDNFTWNEEYSIFNNISIKDAIKASSGKVSEINGILYGLLLNNDIEAYPLLLSTRKNGFATKLYPVLSDFNYMIVYAVIDGTHYFLDATEDYLSFGELPFRCLNGYGRLLNFKDKSRWVDIDIDDQSSTQLRVKIEISDDARIEGTIESKYVNYHAINKKVDYFDNSGDYLEELNNAFPSLEITSVENHNMAKNERHFHETLSFESEALNEIGNEIYINPFVLKFFTKNPFILQQRTYPIEFGFKNNYTYSLQLDLDGYKVVNIPENVTFNLGENQGGLVFNVIEQDESVIVYFKLDLKESFYSSNNYEIIKHLFSQVVDIQTKSVIVLEKNN